MPVTSSPRTALSSRTSGTYPQLPDSAPAHAPTPDHRRMLHDPETYADPMSFNPDRFLAAPGKEPETDPRGMVFGFGRRYVFDVPPCAPALEPNGRPFPFTASAPASSSRTRPSFWRSRCRLRYSRSRSRSRTARSSSPRPSTPPARSGMSPFSPPRLRRSALTIVASFHRTSHPPPYKCEIKPRSAKAEALLHSLIEHKNN